MSDEPLQVSIKILEKEYRIACAAHEQVDLRASARLLDQRMREIRQHGRVIGTDRIAVMAALNIAHDLIQLQRAQPGLNNDSALRLYELQERVASALADDDHEAIIEAESAEIAPVDASIEAVAPIPAKPLDAPNERV